MRVHILFTAAAITIGGLSIPSFAQDASGTTSDRGSTLPPATQPSDRTSGMTGDRMSGDRTSGTDMAPDAKGIRNTIADATEAAVKKDGFDNLVRRFVDADRDRISKNNLTRADWDKLNGRIDQFRKDWKAKYNQDFGVDHRELVFNDQFKITEGTIGEAQPAGARMGASDTSGAAANPSAPDTTPGPQADKTAGGDVNREPGRKVAKFTFPASHNMPDVYVPLIHEFPAAWKIDVPDQLDARKLYDNLLTQLTMIDDHKDMWPTDVNDAYRLVSHHVLMAVMDMKPSSSMDKSGDNTGMDRDRTNTPGTNNPR